MSGFEFEEKPYAEPVITSRCARTFVLKKFRLGQGLHNSMVFGYVDGFVVIS